MYDVGGWKLDYTDGKSRGHADGEGKWPEELEPICLALNDIGLPMLFGDGRLRLDGGEE